MQPVKVALSYPLTSSSSGLIAMLCSHLRGLLMPYLCLPHAVSGLALAQSARQRVAGTLWQGHDIPLQSLAPRQAKAHHVQLRARSDQRRTQMILPVLPVVLFRSWTGLQREIYLLRYPGYRLLDVLLRWRVRPSSGIWS